jgi:hypothetical protein
MSVTLAKFKINDVVIDSDWSDPADLGMIIDMPSADNDFRYEIIWQDGMRTFENLSAMSDFGHVAV